MATEKKSNRRKESAAKRKTAATKENAPAKDFPGELDEPRWSVVSFEKRAAKNLTYAEAEKKLKRLEAGKVSGLCIITDEAAKRISK